MSLAGNSGSSRSESRNALSQQTASTSRVFRRAREVVRPRAPGVKVERQLDGYTRLRTTGAGRRGQRRRAELVRDRLVPVLADVLAAHDELVALANRDELPRDVRARRRADAHDALERARRAIGAYLDGEPTDRQLREGRDLTTRNADALAALVVAGSSIYTGRESVRAHHVAQLRAGVERRGLSLVATGPSWFEVALRRAV